MWIPLDAKLLVGFETIAAYEYLCLLFSYSWQNHNLISSYDFHSYMIRSMEEEFQKIVGVRQVMFSYDIFWLCSLSNCHKSLLLLAHNLYNVIFSSLLMDSWGHISTTMAYLLVWLNYEHLLVYLRCSATEIY